MQRYSPSALAAPLLLLLGAVLMGAACGSDAEPSPFPTQAPSTPELAPSPQPTPLARKQYQQPPAIEIDPNRSYKATIVTEVGDIELELFADKAPNTVNNFVFLAREGFYDNITFHRVLADFMAQAGDPTGTGSGGPGYQFADEFHPDLRHEGPGMLSMANVGANTNGSQFFITFTATPILDGLNPDGSPKDCAHPRVSCHAVFGRVIGGQDAVGRIRLRDPGADPNPGTQIETIRITEE